MVSVTALSRTAMPSHFQNVRFAVALSFDGCYMPGFSLALSKNAGALLSDARTRDGTS
jgi:hypothetical protein